MTTAVDSNILIDIFAGLPVENAEARAAVILAGSLGDLIINTVAYAEIAPRFRRQKELDIALDALGIAVEEITSSTAFEAGQVFSAYLKAGGKRERILADFLIGAHASVSADILLTRDGRFFGPTFQRLRAMTPSEWIAAGGAF